MASQLAPHARTFGACMHDTHDDETCCLCSLLVSTPQTTPQNDKGDDDDPDLPCCLFALTSMDHARRNAMTAAILAGAIPDVTQGLYAPFESLFAASLHRRDGRAATTTTQDDNDDDDDDENEDLDWLDTIFSEEEQLFAHLRMTGWIFGENCDLGRNAVMEKPLWTAVQSVMYRKIQRMIQGDYETTGLYQLAVNWQTTVVEPWLRDLMGDDKNNNGSDSTSRSKRLAQCTAECYCWVRMQEIFDVVTSFPDSLPAVTELRDVLHLAPTGMRTALAHTLHDCLMRRLNHPGADTSQMIDVYICTVQVLRVMGSNSTTVTTNTTNNDHELLSVVTEPVRAYLRGRNDTVRCILTSLTDVDAGGDLYQELRRQDAKPLENVTIDSDDEEDCPDLNWQPPPSILHQQHHHHHHQRASLLAAGTRNNSNSGDCDILAMLVSIYGSKELFVNEYRLMLADKLLANLDYNTDKEVHTLELLKLRFGEISMVSAEVMIKDIEDSVRSNKNIRDALLLRNNNSKPVVVDAAMISHIFWPKLLQNEQLQHHHPRIQAEFDEFSGVYAEQKNPRKLVWMNQLGNVHLELDVTEEDFTSGETHVETKEFTCSPLLATLISHFEDKPTWTATELSNETGVPEHSIQKRMAYWITKRVVTFTSTTLDATKVEYTLASRAERLQHQNEDQHHDHHGLLVDDDGHNNTGQAASASAQEEEDMEAYESYISVMLTSLQQAPLDKIHNMLKMMVSGSETKYNKTPQQLSAFLQHLCRQEKLECGPDGMYKLLKK